VLPEEVLDIIDALEEQNLPVWIDGGWGVDALLGEVTRPHDDVDLVVETRALGAVYECLSHLGLSVADDLFPVRVVLTSQDGRQVDLHPVTFDANGTGWQTRAAPDGSDCPYPAGGFTVGKIMDVAVPCLSAELQLEHHSGFIPRDRDREDMGRLASRFGLELPSTFDRLPTIRRGHANRGRT
jgi:lincosamide nucleotidyltransferase A/C/D/E